MLVHKAEAYICIRRLLHVESTEPKQVYGDKLVFVSERTMKDIIIIHSLSPGLPARTANCVVEFVFDPVRHLLMAEIRTESLEKSVP
jgi:hypothetical protein